MKIANAFILSVLFISLFAVDAKADVGSELQAMLDARAAAISKRDRAAFLASVSDADPQFLQAQTEIFERIGQIPIEGYRLVLTLQDVPEFTRSKDRERFGSQTMVIGVEERFRFAHIDAEERINDLLYTFVKTEDGWKIASDKAGDDLGLFTSRNLWEFGPVAMRRGENFTLFHHPSEAVLAEEFLMTAEQALREANKVWLRDWHQKIPIMLPSDRAELERFIGASFDVSNFVAFAGCSLEREDEDRWEEKAPIVILNRENMVRHSQAGRLQILAHELVHVATCDAAGPYVPLFVHEGMAQLTDSGPTTVLAGAVRRGTFDRKLPEDWEFFSDVGTRIGNAYDESTSIFRFIKERFGLERVNLFFETVGKARLEPGTAEYHLERAITEALGIGVEQFEAEWSEYAQARR